MTRRTTIELDSALLERAKRALGRSTTRGTVEEALRRAADNAEAERARIADKQRQYLKALAGRVDASVLASDQMWR
jgi:Arc/MetJ family transcription regulator